MSAPDDLCGCARRAMPRAKFVANPDTSGVQPPKPFVESVQGDECECRFCRGVEPDAGGCARDMQPNFETPEPAEFVARDYYGELEQYALGWQHGWDDHEASEARGYKPKMSKRDFVDGFAVGLVIGIVMALFFVSFTAKAQMLAPNVEATTPCLNGKTKTIVDLAVIVAYDTATKTFAFTDSAGEVIGHEMIHQAQARRYAPACPPYGMHPELLLRDEVEAYCYTRRMYVARTHRTKEEVNQDIEGILQDQFGSMSVHDVAVAWERGCP